MRIWLIGSLLTVVFIVAVVGVREYYYTNLKPVSRDQQSIIVTVPQGATITQIGNLLQQKHLIRSSTVFDWYVHSYNLTDKLEAGSFALSPSQSLQTIVGIIASGHVAEGTVTILPGKTIAQISDMLINHGFSPQTVAAAMNPSLYSGLPIIADKPSGVDTLEGLLYPDTFDKTASTNPSVIIRESLVEMGDHITPSMKAAFTKEGLSVYQAITLASIIEQEVSKPSDRSQVAQVFLSRLKLGMPLGSDVTANYGATLNGQQPSLTYDSPYNTLLHTGLPPTPIGTVGLNALEAVANPANTNWLYFVTGDNGTTYFESTLQQHNADTAQYCHKLCSQP